MGGMVSAQAPTNKKISRTQKALWIMDTSKGDSFRTGDMEGKLPQFNGRINPCFSPFESACSEASFVLRPRYGMKKKRLARAVSSLKTGGEDHDALGLGGE
jgi:hypothetical protein